MTIEEVRQKYLEFFKNRGHKVIPPAPLVNENPEEAGTMFTPFGMQQMVPYLLGEKHKDGTKLVDSQPCIRVEDIEEVGDNRHTTFFEMLGNWSLGDYFKEDQLKWFFQFLVDKEEGIGLEPEKLYVSVFGGDENFKILKNGKHQNLTPDVESVDIWKRLFESVGVSAEVGDRIRYYPAKKNWWSMSGTPNNMPIGEIGGPDSEVFYDFGAELKLHENSEFKSVECHPNCDCGRFLEIGNSVFIQYQKVGDKTFEELPNKNVDFGGGLERLAAAVNNDPDVFNISIFNKMISHIEAFTGIKYEDNKQEMRIIADHIRASAFLIKSGVIPSNKLHGYVLRRLIRRSAIKFKKLELSTEKIKKLMHSLTSTIVGEYARSGYFEFKEQYDQLKIADIIFEEVKKFEKSIDNGLKEIEKSTSIDGGMAFDLYQTYGYPLELTLEIAKEKGFEIDINEFKKAFEHHQELSRTASAGVFKGGLADHSQEVTRLHTVHHLILAALQQVVDTNIVQKGSNITAERMRMDFNLDRKLTEDEIKQVEELVNQKIDESLPVTKKIMPREEAEHIGAQMEFGKKYPDNVSVYFVGPVEEPFSKEFCGGPHVENTSEIGGHVTITKEKSASAGVRRIYAEISR